MKLAAGSIIKSPSERRNKIMQSYHEFLSEVLIHEQELQDKVKELGEIISRDYQEQDLHLVCILRGGVLFLTDLMRSISVPHSIDFMAISSYGSGVREASGHIRLTMDLRDDIQGRNVLLVEDIVDSGHTLRSILDLLATRNPASLKVCTLLDKAERRETEVPIDYVGFVIPNKYVFGYGLDLDEFYRELPFIGVVNEDKYTPPDH
jgi:hypoxanthine phosphoribosyltransferase